ncbi:MAG TPA: hypothetical protein VMK05_02135 [Burkholderiales bacterium]|nr:hypothetical protein [Burkholderiales bacterium]
MHGSVNKAAQDDVKQDGAAGSADALAFSRYGDEVFSRVQARFPTASTRRLAIAQPLAAQRFEALQTAVRTYISACLGSRETLSEAQVCAGLLRAREQGKLHNYTPGGMLVPKREHTLEWNALHRAMSAVFEDYDLDGVIDGIDLPINVRLVFGDTGKGKLAPFSSAKLHSDVWAGVPHDAVVCVLPVLGDIENLTIVMGEMKPELEMGSMRAMDDYEDGRGIKVDVPYREVVLEHGTLYMADCRLLHCTARRKREGVRVSIDFRFRMKEPAYRAMVPEIVGPESVDTRVPYDTWLNVGKDRMFVCDETMEEAAKTRHLVNSLPVYNGPYRIVPLFPGVPGGGRGAGEFKPKLVGSAE